MAEHQECRPLLAVDLFSATSVVSPPRAGDYVTLMADPPWWEAGGGKIKRGADRHYPLMKTRDICALPVAGWMAQNAHCYIWVTNNFLRDGLEVIETWGFRYVTTITWFKSKRSVDDEITDDERECFGANANLQVGLGQYFRGCTEQCLFGVRGNVPYRMTTEGKRAQGRTGFHAPRNEHSAKPVRMRQMVETVSPGPYLEMFARQPASGWDVWGNESTGERLSA